MRYSKISGLILAIIATTIAITHMMTPVYSGPSSGEWVMTFNDEFEGAQLDRSKWDTGWYAGVANVGNGQQHYLVDSAITVEQGMLVIRADRQNYNGYRYTSGMVQTRNNFSQQRGFFEIRARWPKGSGLWAAFWMLPRSQTFPPELDVELLGNHPNEIFSNIHYTTSNGSRGQSGSFTNIGLDATTDFHTYGIEWSPNAIIWYFDGREIRRFNNTSALPAESMYILLDLAVGGWWSSVGSPNSTLFPQYYEIDYVRVWQNPAWATIEPSATPRSSTTPTSTPTTTAVNAATATPTQTPTATTTPVANLPTTTPRPTLTATATLNPEQPSATVTDIPAPHITETTTANLEPSPTSEGGNQHEAPTSAVYLPFLQQP
jgi:beta-glucanase (GH16 family)